MECLRATLLKSGKGRRPSLPEMIIDFKLLAQLHFLRIEGGKSMKEAERWLEKLFPKISSPLSRVWARVGRVVETAQRLTGEALVVFLKTEVDFNYISDCLDAVGVTRALQSQQFKRTILTNNVVLDLSNFMINEGYTYPALLDNLILLSSHPFECTADNLRKRVQAAHKVRKKLISNSKKNPEALQMWLGAAFFLHSGSTNISISKDRPASTSTCSSPLTPVIKFAPPAASTPEDQDGRFICGQNVQYMRKLRQELEDAREWEDKKIVEVQAMRELYESSQDALKKLQGEYNFLLSKFDSLRDDYSSIKTQKEDSDAALKRISASNLYRKYSTLQKDCSRLEAAAKEVEDLRWKNEELKKEKANLQKYLSQARRARDHHKANADRIDQEAVNSFLSDAVPEVNLREGNRFSDSLRRTVIALLSRCNVSTSQCSKCIQVVASELFGINWSLKDLPSQQTLRDITDEVHVLSKVLTPEKLQHSRYILHLDGTSRDKQKIVGHQVTLENGDTLSLGLGFIDVATEDAATLLDVTTAILRELGEVYAPEAQESVFKEILSKLTGTMTDRASVMKKFCKDLNEACQTTLDTSDDLAFLHCNAHFLLGLSSSGDAALKTVEAELNLKLGRDNYPKFASFNSAENATSRFVRTACAILAF